MFCILEFILRRRALGAQVAAPEVCTNTRRFDEPVLCVHKRACEYVADYPFAAAILRFGIRWNNARSSVVTGQQWANAASPTDLSVCDVRAQHT